MHVNQQWMAFAIINTLIALYLALNAIAKKHSAVGALPNGILACVFWFAAFYA